ncbi:MAG: ABC transporter permease [Chloroflexota bacterium]|jgi:ABC-2 type transport system permease protein|nr:ABC transporter permease [Dehalococcoidia bacterium]MDW8046068.1 ABC transporter permease [Chloroflexota bacterium]
MNQADITLFRIAVGQVVGRRRVWLVGLLCLLPVGVAAVYLAVGRAEPDRWTANVLMNGIVISAVVPLVALLVATAAMGSELEEGTIVFLLTKPVARWRIAAAELAAAAVVALPSVAAAAAVAGIIATWEGGSRQAVAAFLAGALGATAAYCAVFTALAAVTSRALVIGLAYVFLWEGVVSSLFEGAKWLSIRRYGLGIADALAGLPPVRFDAPLPAAPLFLAAAIAGGFAAAVWALERFQLRGAS